MACGDYIPLGCSHETPQREKQNFGLQPPCCHQCVPTAACSGFQRKDLSEEKHNKFARDVKGAWCDWACSVMCARVDCKRQSLGNHMPTQFHAILNFDPFSPLHSLALVMASADCYGRCAELLLRCRSHVKRPQPHSRGSGAHPIRKPHQRPSAVNCHGSHPGAA